MLLFSAHRSDVLKKCQLGRFRIRAKRTAEPTNSAVTAAAAISREPLRFATTELADVSVDRFPAVVGGVWGIAVGVTAVVGSVVVAGVGTNNSKPTFPSGPTVKWTVTLETSGPAVVGVGADSDGDDDDNSEDDND